MTVTPDPARARRVFTLQERALALAMHRRRQSIIKIVAAFRRRGWRVSDRAISRLLRENGHEPRPHHRLKGERIPALEKVSDAQVRIAHLAYLRSRDMRIADAARNIGLSPTRFGERMKRLRLETKPAGRRNWDPAQCRTLQQIDQERDCDLEQRRRTEAEIAEMDRRRRLRLRAEGIAA